MEKATGAGNGEVPGEQKKSPWFPFHERDWSWEITKGMMSWEVLKYGIRLLTGNLKQSGPIIGLKPT